MTFYQGLATVLLRALAALYLIESVGVFANLGIGWFTQPVDPDESARRYYVTNLMSYAAYLLIGAAVWIFAPRMGRLVAAAVPAEAPSLSIDSERLIEIGVFLVGLFFVAEYAPQALAESAQLFITMAQQTDAERLSGARVVYFPGWRQFASDWTITAIALIIAFRARGIAKLFAWLRTAGQYEEKPAPEKSVAGE